MRRHYSGAIATLQRPDPISRRTVTVVRTGLREHWLITVLVLLGATVRGLAMAAYSPALLFPDSWGYIATGLTGAFVGLPTIHPVGYPVLVRLLTLPDRSLAELVALQHLAALGMGVGVYAALLRARLPRWAAAAAAALVLLDGYTVTLEQYVMSDTFFTVGLVLALLVLVWPRLGSGDPARSPAPTAARATVCGLLIAGTTLVREVAPFTLPVLIVYLLWTRAGWRPLVALLLAAALPLLAYGALIDSRFHVFSLTATSGWTLYGRVGGFADCRGVPLGRLERRLCETPAQRAAHPSAPDWYIWGPSPARRLFHPSTQSVAEIAPTDHVLQSFARAMVLHHPLSFAGATLTDFVRYFTPGAVPYNDAVSATSLPRTAALEAHSPATQRRDLPGLRLTVGAPAGVVRAYRAVVHVPRPVLALLALAAVLALGLRVPGRREILLLAGSAVLILLGTAATGGFGLRYLLPAVPLLAIGGGIAVAQLLARRRPA